MHNDSGALSEVHGSKVVLNIFFTHGLKETNLSNVPEQLPNKFSFVIK